MCQNEFGLSEIIFYVQGRAVAQAVSRNLPQWRYGSGHVEFVVDKAALGQVFSEYFGFPLPLIPPTAPHSSSPTIRGWCSGLVVAEAPSGLCSTPPTEKKRTTLRYILEVTKKHRGISPRANSKDRANAACRRNVNFCG
jgi:hypothetical protein